MMHLKLHNGQNFQESGPALPGINYSEEDQKCRMKMLLEDPHHADVITI